MKNVILAALIFAANGVHAKDKTIQVWGKSTTVVDGRRARKSAEFTARRVLTGEGNRAGFKVDTVTAKLGRKIYPLGYPFGIKSTKRPYALCFRDATITAKITHNNGQQEVVRRKGRVIVDKSWDIARLELYGPVGNFLKSGPRKPDRTLAEYQKHHEAEFRTINPYAHLANQSKKVHKTRLTGVKVKGGNPMQHAELAGNVVVAGGRELAGDSPRGLVNVGYAAWMNAWFAPFNARGVVAKMPQGTLRIKDGASTRAGMAVAGMQLMLEGMGVLRK